MFDQVDSRLTEWVGAILNDIPVSFAAPAGMQQPEGINLYLMDIISAPPLRSQGQPPWQLKLHYLVTAWAETPAEMHHLCGQLVFAAMQEPELELILEPPSGEMWAALGITPRPAFILQVLVQLPRPEKALKPVLKPLQIEQYPLTRLRGQVLGPEEMPIANALVRIPRFDLHTRTDQDGHFFFAAIPAGRPFNQLTVQAKGYTQDYEIEIPSADKQLVLHFNPFAEHT